MYLILLNIFYDNSSLLQGFNQNGSIFINLYYCSSSKSDKKIKLILCHELAHNLHHHHGALFINTLEEIIEKHSIIIK